MKKFGYNITVECEEEVTETEVIKMMDNIAARLEGYHTDSPDFLGKYSINLKIDYDSISDSRKRQK